MIGTHYTQTSHVYTDPTLCWWICVWFGECIPSLGLFHICFHSCFLLGPLSSPRLEYKLPDSQGCMECLSRPSMAILFPESSCLALWHSTTSQEKPQPQAGRATIWSFLGCFCVLVFPPSTPTQVSLLQQQTCWLSQTSLLYFQFPGLITFVKFVQH